MSVSEQELDFAKLLTALDNACIITEGDWMEIVRESGYNELEINKLFYRAAVLDENDKTKKEG